MFPHTIFWMQGVSGPVSICEEEDIVTAYDSVEEKDLGFMLYDMDYRTEKIWFLCFSGL